MEIAIRELVTLYQDITTPESDHRVPWVYDYHEGPSLSVLSCRCLPPWLHARFRRYPPLHDRLAQGRGAYANHPLLHPIIAYAPIPHLCRQPPLYLSVRGLCGHIRVGTLWGYIAGRRQYPTGPRSTLLTFPCSAEVCQSRARGGWLNAPEIRG